LFETIDDRADGVRPSEGTVHRRIELGRHLRHEIEKLAGQNDGLGRRVTPGDFFFERGHEFHSASG
jgi:hypothetical protein